MKIEIVKTISKYPDQNWDEDGKRLPDTYRDVCLGGVVYVDGERYGEASDCDLGRWIICKDIPDDAPKDKFGFAISDDGELDGCYPADSIEAMAYGIAECVEGVEHSDIAVVDQRTEVTK